MHSALQKTLTKLGFCLVIVNIHQTTMFFKTVGCLPRLFSQMLSLHPCLLYTTLHWAWSLIWNLVWLQEGKWQTSYLTAVSKFIMVTKWKFLQCRKISLFNTQHISGTKLILSLKMSSHRTDLFAGQKGSFAHSVKVALRGWGNILWVLRDWIRKVTNYLQNKVTQISLLKTINH